MTNHTPIRSAAGMTVTRTNMKMTRIERILSRGYVTRNAPITAAIAPLAPKLGTVERGLTATWASKHAPDQIEHQVSPSTHRVFDFGTKGPQEHHIADDMRPAGAHDHRRHQRDPVMAGDDVGGDRRPPGHEGLTAPQFQCEDERVDEDDDSCDDGTMQRAA